MTPRGRGAPLAALLGVWVEVWGGDRSSLTPFSPPQDYAQSRFEAYFQHKAQCC